MTNIQNKKRSDFLAGLEPTLADFEISPDATQSLLHAALQLYDDEEQVFTAKLRTFGNGLGSEQNAIDPHLLSDNTRVSHGTGIELLAESVILIGSLAAVVSLSSAALAGLLLFVHNYRRKSSEVDGLSGLILKTLKDNEQDSGLSVSELLELLPLKNENRPTFNEVKKRLDCLQTTRLNSGVMTSLVARTDNRWRTVNI